MAAVLGPRCFNIPWSGVTTELFLEHLTVNQLKGIDRRTQQEVEDPFLAMELLTEFDQKESASRFRDKRFTCDICLQSVIGTVCEKLHTCGHVHCVHCLSAHINLKIQSGNVTKIDCPAVKCEQLVDTWFQMILSLATTSYSKGMNRKEERTQCSVPGPCARVRP